jgi:hypothetical protein
MLSEQNPKINKKTLLIAVIILILLGAGWFIYKKQKTVPAGPTQEEIIVKQMEELNALRQSAGYKEPTAEEINKQMEELNKLKGQSIK